ncbi:hypothetical protein QYM36_008629 [Artemia franciscana]|uniref:Tetrapyrrole biosynthesis uroporphyrinogen III synthase domain-containing protein n=1 Tax=Artemia franciscana TaxID=6661 RepID=A0AA88I2F8_ARTSF|nr:hypothetical protein QYM36_008629 [Artemia franciscana]
MASWIKHYSSIFTVINYALRSRIILTSPRAVEALKIAIDEFGIQDYETKLLSIWKTKLIYCVGEATQRNALSTLGLEGVGGDTGNAATLGTFPADERKPLLFPSGELRREELPKILSNANLPFSSIIVYNTTSSPTLEEDIKCCLNSSVSEYKLLNLFFIVHLPGYRWCGDKIHPART